MFLIRIGQKLLFPLMIIVSIILIVTLQLGFIFLLIALLPSIAFYYIDDSYDRATFRTVFACNLAATVPSLAPVFKSGLKLKYYDISSIAANPGIWLLIYGGAAAGWCMIHFGNKVARVFLEIQYKMRIMALEHAQERILEEWGDSVKQIVTGQTEKTEEKDDII